VIRALRSHTSHEGSTFACDIRYRSRRRSGRCNHAEGDINMNAMQRIIIALLLALGVAGARAQSPQPGATPPPRNIALINGQWFTGSTFERRTVYSVARRFASARPKRIDETLDLAGTWIVPPFGEAHNHNIDGAAEDRSREALRRYLADGVFYLKIQGNYALTDEMRRRLPMNRPDAPDVLLAQAFLTASGGHPIRLPEQVLFAQGYYPGIVREQLRNRLYFTIDTEADLNAKWADILAPRPDFLKLNLWDADEFAARRDDTRYVGMRGLDPNLLPKVVARARQHRLRTSVHI
jgi:hypothetical protein